MFNRIKSYILGSESTTSSLDNTITTNKETSEESHGSTWVYIWNMTQNGPGHAAIQVGGSKPKMNSDDSGDYISIHPDLPAIGITSVLPLPGELAKTLKEDMEIEGSAKTKDRINDFGSMQEILQKNSADPLLPSQTIKIENLDTNAMRAYINKTKDEVETGKLSYQLFPKINLLGLFKDIPVFISQDPIDIEMNRRFSSNHDEDTSQVKNCTTLVSDILRSGGQEIPESKMPWGITPDGLADVIRKSSPF